MADLLALSARYIDGDLWEGPGSVNRITTELSEVADGVAMIEAFSHIVVLRTEAGLVLFDTSLEPFAAPAIEQLRRYSDAPIHSIVYTHGHVDHVGGAGAFLADAARRGHARPQVVGHENVAPRFDRYELTNGYNRVVNERQFGAGGFGGATRFGPAQFVAVDTPVQDARVLSVGELTVDLRHDRGETDDHLWAYIPELRAVAVGDFLAWVFPNAGNPQKVQRYPGAWARALRKMAALDPELLLPAHGLPIGGQARIARVLDDVATALESLMQQTLDMMNAGATLDAIVHGVAVPGDLLDRPYLRPVYDEPEFVVRNIWRLYGGWYDGDPAHLKPAPASELAGEVAALAGGVSRLAQRAQVLADAGSFRLACHLAEMAVQAAPGDRDCHAVRAAVYDARRRGEASLMARGIFGTASRASQALVDGQNGQDGGEP